MSKRKRKTPFERKIERLTREREDLSWEIGDLYVKLRNANEKTGQFEEQQATIDAAWKAKLAEMAADCAKIGEARDQAKLENAILRRLIFDAMHS